MNEIAVFGGGCFWCTEAVFSMLRGVTLVTPGYAGGDVLSANYASVSTGETKHAEVIQVQFNPDVITFQQLLSVFFVSHDATQLNQQGADVGTQYRSVIFYTTPEQKNLSEQYIKETLKEVSAPIVTEVVPLVNFYPAEEYHKKYYTQNSNAQYCQIVIAPKIEKVEKQFKSLLETHAQ